MAQTTKNKVQLKTTTDPIPAALAARVRDKLISSRVSLLINKPFFGNVGVRLELTPADEWCETAATDGRKFYYNHAFIDMLKPREVDFLVGHEVLHAVYDHMGRAALFDKKLFNIAADYIINLDLVQQNVGELITTVDSLYDRKYTGWSTEQVYDELYKNAEKINIDQLLGQMFDEHMSGDQEGEGEGSGDGEDEGGGSGKGQRPTLSKEEQRAIRDEMRDAVLNAAKQCSAGDIPMGVKRMIQELTEPKMNWRELLRQSLESTLQSDYSWLRLSRKGWDNDAILPGMVNDQMIDVCVGLDMSGSIGSAQARDFLSEVNGIMQQFDQYRVHVWCFDTQVYNDEVFTSDDGKDIAEYVIKGGGGTSFEANWEFMKANDIQPKRFVMFTDMYPCGGWGDPNYCDTVFVAHGTKDIIAPFGITCIYDEAAQ